MKFSILFVIFIIFQLFTTFNSFTINSYYYETNLNAIGKVYRCRTTNFPTSSGIFVTKITGQHESEKNNNDVEAIGIDGNYTLSFVPRNFSFFFPFLRAMTIWYSSIEILYGDEFDEFDYFDYISIQHSYLKTISSRLFESSPQMVHVWFANNMIERVGYDLFTPLDISLLEFVGFGNNACINQDITDGNQTAITSLINELQQNCPFDDNFSILTSTSSLSTPTDDNLTCPNRGIINIVCDLKDSLIEIQENLSTKDERVDSFSILLGENLTEADEKTNEKLSKSNGKIDELKTKLRQLNEKLQVKHEKIVTLKSEFEERLMRLEEVLLNSATNCFILKFTLLVCFVLILKFL
ncbi:hypothetical protein PVAND_016239 [Polypedilum vanderplanki]|uniref:Uncharacterized protein n=1 Tax=Polypedilum vanderplanki TaxID=319348 RepID=A0A9J6BEI8_POLVA|nr:hypothetical protein PVAND_016239 [Polypedilum vanderplanki]